MPTPPNMPYNMVALQNAFAQLIPILAAQRDQKWQTERDQRLFDQRLQLFNLDRQASDQRWGQEFGFKKEQAALDQDYRMKSLERQQEDREAMRDYRQQTRLDSNTRYLMGREDREIQRAAILRQRETDLRMKVVSNPALKNKLLAERDNALFAVEKSYADGELNEEQRGQALKQLGEQYGYLSGLQPEKMPEPGEMREITTSFNGKQIKIPQVYDPQKGWQINKDVLEMLKPPKDDEEKKQKQEESKRLENLRRDFLKYVSQQISEARKNDLGEEPDTNRIYEQALSLPMFEELKQNNMVRDPAREANDAAIKEAYRNTMSYYGNLQQSAAPQGLPQSPAIQPAGDDATTRGTLATPGPQAPSQPRQALAVAEALETYPPLKEMATVGVAPQQIELLVQALAQGDLKPEELPAFLAAARRRYGKAAK